MTKRDFEFIASVICTKFAPAERERIASAFADELAKTNPRFNRVRFMHAVEFVTEHERLHEVCGRMVWRDFFQE